MSDRRPTVIVSACLLGVACNHRGGASPAPDVAALADRYRLVAVCPEVAGGLPTPRAAAEIDPDTGRVRTEAGVDVTGLYERGAAHTVQLALSAGAVGAVLKARSPSCGSGQIYDGTHQHRLTAGAGVTVTALRAAGVPVCAEGEPLPWDAPGA